MAGYLRRARMNARVAPVGPIDKLSLPITIAIVPAAVFLGEAVSWRLGLGVLLMTSGASPPSARSRRSRVEYSVFHVDGSVPEGPP
jgi:hypothetical protein